MSYALNLHYVHSTVRTDSFNGHFPDENGLTGCPWIYFLYFFLTYFYSRDRTEPFYPYNKLASIVHFNLASIASTV